MNGVLPLKSIQLNILCSVRYFHIPQEPRCAINMQYAATLRKYQKKHSHKHLLFNTTECQHRRKINGKLFDTILLQYTN